MLVIITAFANLSYDHVFRQVIHQVINLLLQAFLCANDVWSVFTNHIYLHLAPDIPGGLKTGTGELQVVGHQFDIGISGHQVFTSEFGDW